MALAAGTRLGVYQVVAAIGSGGMGDVYRARDTKLQRDVALKVLPELFALEPDRLARFEREAQVLAALNHPNIAAIHGFEESNGVRALVLELVEGPTLADRIARGPVPVDEALPIARQIAEALEAAHEHGIIHRDLKPANIKLRPDGTVKVLDFGLAKALEGDGATADVSNSPTLTAAATRLGVILGTAAYMAPEQAKGVAVDRRADIFAFGAVLYEMLTGRRAFPGDTTTETLASVLKSEPDWTRLPGEIPEGVRRLLRRCLQKDRNRRLQTAGDVRIELEDALSEHAPVSVSAGITKRGVRIPWMIAVAAIAIAAVALLVLYVRSSPVTEAPEIRTEIVTSATSDATAFALSPDGRQIVFVALGDGPSRLWLRSLVGTTSRPLAGTEGAIGPFWSPDSRSVGFFAEGRLRRVDVGGGAPQTLTSAFAFGGGTWSTDDVILFAQSNLGPLFRIAASGGEAVAVTKLDRQAAHLAPAFLPDGRQFLFYAVAATPDAAGIHLGSLDTGDVTRLTAATTAGVFASSGWLLWVRDGTLVAQRLDLDRRELTGEQVTIADGVGVDRARGAFSVSATGLMAYRSGGVARRQLTWFDRAGKVLGVLGPPEDTVLNGPDVSPDGRRVAVSRVVQGRSDLWLLDGTRTTRFTFTEGADSYPSWSPDGERLVWGSVGDVQRRVYVKPSSGAGTEQILFELPSASAPITNDWSPDGRFVLYHSRDPQTSRDLWVLPMDGDRKPQVFLKTNFDEGAGQFSPDGHWVAYQSNESGRYEVYVRPFAPSGGGASAITPSGAQWQVSTSGGVFARWRGDGRELYWVGPDARLMAASIAVMGDRLEPGTPMALFQTRIVGGGADNGAGRQYDVARDGRFLINTIVEEAAAPITLLQNWKPPEQ